jgi:hypothetical protein
MKLQEQLIKTNNPYTCTDKPSLTKECLLTMLPLIGFGMPEI